MSTILPLFWHLPSANKKERIDASVKLVAALEHFQSTFVPKDSPETSEDEDEDGETHKSDGLGALNAQDVSYSLRRLIRGLASPRESSRLGFAVALTEVCAPFNYAKYSFTNQILSCLASVPDRHCHMLSDCSARSGLVQDTGLYDWPGRTRRALRSFVRSYLCHPIWSTLA